MADKTTGLNIKENINMQESHVAEWECINSGMDYWTGILEWTTGMVFFGFYTFLGGLIDSY